MTDSKKILSKLDKHDQAFNRIFKKLEKHDQLFELMIKRFDGVDKRFVNVDKRFDKIDKQLKNHSTQIIKNSENIEWIKENMATKDDFNNLENTVENLTHKVKNISDDKLFIVEWLKRLQTQVDKIN